VQATHHGGEAARCARGRRHTKQIEQRGAADGILVAHGGFHLFTPRVFVMRFQLGAGFSQLPE
jgi:hypothetical protein